MKKRRDDEREDERQDQDKMKREKSRSQFCIEVFFNNGYVSFAICYVLLDRLVHFLDVMVRIPRVGEVHTHQFDALAVDHDCGGDGPFVDLFSVNDSVPPLVVQHDSNAVFVVDFPAPMKMCL